MDFDGFENICQVCFVQLDFSCVIVQSVLSSYPVTALITIADDSGGCSFGESASSSTVTGSCTEPEPLMRCFTSPGC